MKKTAYRIEIVEQADGWWVGEIWNANDEMVYRAHAKSKEVAQRQMATEVGINFDSSIKPVVTIRALGSN